ncbi:MAG: class I SAM-dependent methyltransferase [Actinomycetota bacterium]
MVEADWNPDTYADMVAAEIPGYDELQAAVATATAGLPARTILELGTGTGETALRVLALHPDAAWTGIDASGPMVTRARERLPRANLRVARFSDPLPPGPFDLAVSVLAVHHLDGDAKRDLFTRVAQITDLFVLGDVVVPERPEDAVIELDAYDLPSSAADQVAWLENVGFDVRVTPIRADLAVFRCRRR